MHLLTNKIIYPSVIKSSQRSEPYLDADSSTEAKIPVGGISHDMERIYMTRESVCVCEREINVAELSVCGAYVVVKRNLLLV